MEPGYLASNLSDGLVASATSWAWVSNIELHEACTR